MVLIPKAEQSLAPKWAKNQEISAPKWFVLNGLAGDRERSD
jgi:hypothetical protein